MDLSTNQLNDMLWLDINQDQTCFVVGNESGFRIYQLDPLQFTHSRYFDGAGGIGIVAMLFRSNILALVGGGRNPRYPPTKVVLWDDREGVAIAELTFRTLVRAVRLRRDIIAVSVESKVFIYRFADLALLDSLDTRNGEMDSCLLSVCGSPESTIVACPGNVPGRVNVCFYDPNIEPSVPPSNISAARLKITSIMAHESSLAVVSLNFEGSRVATASVKGTLIRVFDTTTGQRLVELRRGAERVDIYSISFSPQSDWLAVSSDKGTIHVFSLRVSSGGANFTVNQKSSLFPISKVLPSYFQSQWSFAQFRVPDYRSVCAFGKDPYTVICLCADGSYYKVKFDPILGGEMKRVKFDKFIDSSHSS
jgi:WD40 repeat protein